MVGMLADMDVNGGLERGANGQREELRATAMMTIQVVGVWLV